MNFYQNLANATLRIECGDSIGSGFHFLQPNIIVTNYHVIANYHSQAPIIAFTEKEQKINLKLVSYSPINEFDFAILTCEGTLPEGRTVLMPKTRGSETRGTEIAFSGFPHGIPHLIIQRAIISGQLNKVAFYIDGSVNGGNSGGPIVDFSDGKIIGIVTQRRFLGAQDLNQLQKAAKQLRAHCQLLAGRGGIQIMGIDFGGFSSLMAEAMLLIQDVLEANANTGIGIGYYIDFVVEKCKESKLIQP
jgi:S1-C subfamily serine protease